MEPTSVRDWFRRGLAEDKPGESVAPNATEAAAHAGTLELADFQRRAAERGLRIVRAFGGVVLADAVGLGKTRVSLAIAKALLRDFRLRNGRSGKVWVCVPARLSSQWSDALKRAEVRDFAIVTHTMLSRGEVEFESPAVVVVDEAHRFRNPKAKRSQALAQLAGVAPLVLATATPVCNSRWDLYHLLGLFLAEHDLRAAVGHNLREAFELADAGEFDLTELVEQVVIRRTEPPSRAGFGRRPNVSLEVLRYDAGEAERWLWQNLEGELGRMSMQLFAADWPRQLLVQYVLKRWESGAEALASTLSKMCEFHRRWLEARRHGRTLSRKSFRALFDGEVKRRQGVFPFLFDAPVEAPFDGPGGGQRCQEEPVRRDLEVLEGLERRAKEVAGDKDAKRGAIFELVAGDNDKTLVFTSYQHAARGLYEYLVEGLGAQARVGLVTGDGAFATGLGRTSAEEVVRRFAPLSNGLDTLDAHQRLDVLVSTDCLSEGVNLQDCGRVVLADLPYSPLGVEQRIGRLVRPGGPHDRVTVYLPRPRAWADSLGMRRRLDKKIADAAGSGAAFVAAKTLAPSGQTRPSPESPLAALTRLDALCASLGCAQSGLSAERSCSITRSTNRFWRARARRGPPRLWAQVLIEESRQSRRMWCLVREGEPAELRLSKLVGELVGDSESEAPIEPAEPSPALLEAAKRAVSRREKLLRAARLAPFPLRLDAPQRRLWARLCDFVEMGELSMTQKQVSRLRHELLRSFPRGIERCLGQLAGAELPPARLLGQVRRVVGDVPRWSPKVRLEIVGGLELS